MQITLYSYKPLEVNIRSEFELPAWPYTKNPEHFKLFEDYMRYLTVFYYADSDVIVAGRDVSYPLYIKPEGWEGVLTPPKDIAWLNSVYVDKEYKPIKWPQDRPDGNFLVEKMKVNDIAKDMFAWSEWNVPVKDIEFTPNSIRRHVITESLDPELCNKGKCFESKLGLVSRIGE
jgi:hypothetical protein